MSQPQSSKTPQPKTGRSTAARAPASNAKPATGPKGLTDVQLEGLKKGINPNSISDLANSLLQPEEMFQENGKVYLVKNKEEVKGVTVSDAGVIKGSDGRSIGFINMPRVSKTDKMRKATYAPINFLRGKDK